MIPVHIFNTTKLIYNFKRKKSEFESRFRQVHRQLRFCSRDKRGLGMPERRDTKRRRGDKPRLVTVFKQPWKSRNRAKQLRYCP